MSRLDSFIRRVSAQRLVLDHVCDLVAAIPGPVLEFGLGNGRTFDHLRKCLPDRRIIAFDRIMAAHASSAPPAEDFMLGEICDTAPRLAGIEAALLHADIETNYADIDAETALWLPPIAVCLLKSGGIVTSGLALIHPELTALDLPDGVPEQRYFLYRRT
jgi:hypothetical protein